jgi:hypothetical protein
MAPRKSSPGVVSFPRCSPRRGGRWSRMRSRLGSRHGPGWALLAVRPPRRRPAWPGWRQGGRPGSQRWHTEARWWWCRRRPGLLRDALKADVWLTIMGQHCLAGVGRAGQVFQLGAGGLPAGFLPPRSLEGVRQC